MKICSEVERFDELDKVIFREFINLISILASKLADIKFPTAYRTKPGIMDYQ